MKKIKIVLMVVVVFICLAVIIHGQGSKIDEGVVGQVTKTAGKSDMPVNEQQEINNTNNANVSIDTKANTNIVKKKGRIIEQTDKELRFLDEEGKIEKKISLGPKSKLIKKGKIDGIEYQNTEEENTDAIISKNGEYVGIFYHKWESSVSGEHIGYIENKNDKFIFMNNKGEILWERTGLSSTSILMKAMSDDGKRIMLIEVEKVTKEGITIPKRIVIYNNEGKEIWGIDVSDREISSEKITANGKYGCFEYTKYDYSKRGVLFFDIDNKKIHEADGIFATFCEITDDGVGRAYKKEPQPVKDWKKKERIKKLIYEYKFK